MENYTPDILSNLIIPIYVISFFILSKEQEKPEKSSTEEKELFQTSSKIVDIGYDIFNLLDESEINITLPKYIEISYHHSNKFN